MRFLEAIADAVLDRSPEELTAAMVFAATIGAVMAGVYALGRKKSSPSPMFVGGLALVAGVMCMAAAAGYFKNLEGDRTLGSAAKADTLAGWPASRPGRGGPPPAWRFPRAGWSSGFHVVVAADENRDGRLTTEEAARLIREADADGDGSVDFTDIDQLMKNRFRSLAWPSAPGPGPIKPVEEEGDGPPDDDQGEGEDSHGTHTKRHEERPAPAWDDSEPVQLDSR